MGTDGPVTSDHASPPPRVPLGERPVVFAPSGTVCRKCWHGLRGLEYGGVCPECGASIGAGMDPLWWGNGSLARLWDAAGAARLAFWVTLGAMVLLVAIGVLQEAMSARSAPVGPLFAATSIAALVAWAAYLWVIGRCVLALARARLVSDLLRWVFLAAVTLSLASVTGTAIQSLIEGGSVSAWGASRWQAVFTVGFALVTLSTLLLWSVALRQAAVRIVRTSLRGWGLALVGCMTLLILIWLPTAVFTIRSAFGYFTMFGMSGGGTPWYMSLMEYAVLALPSVIIPSYILLVVNTHLLHRALKRFIAARSDAI